VEEVELGGDEGGGVSVAGPAGYVNAVERLVEEGAELGEGREDEGFVWGEGEVCWWVGFEAEVE
jgi:hypothetical protein